MNANLQCQLQKALDRWRLFAPFVGTTVTVMDSRLGSWSGASGYADVDLMAPMPVNAPCYIYSITKTFTAICCLQLAERGSFSLDETIAHYLPELSLPPTVTIRRLLNHTAGIPNYTQLEDYVPTTRASPSQPWTYEEVLGRTCLGELDFEPGEDWHYSNTGYMLLKRSIENVTAGSYAEAIAAGIIEPLGLTNTYVATDVDDGRLIPGYCPELLELDVMSNVSQVYHPDWCLTGLIVSTTEEIARLYEALFAGQLLSPASLAEMLEWTPCDRNAGNQRNPNGFFSKPSYGLGLMVDPDWKFGGLYGHGGSGPGFNTWAMYVPDFHGGSLAIVIFCNNTMEGHPFRLCKVLMKLLDG
ncbi:MAG: serine hydrolase domain-containing protein [Cyanobacteria bacterium P01_A01_bin.3]